MNIFALDDDPIMAAHYHADKHVVKMILEYSQILAFAHTMCDGDVTAQLRVPCSIQLSTADSYRNHPCTKWARESSSNYHWLHACLVGLCAEYSARYGKVHQYQQSGFIGQLATLPTLISHTGRTPWAQAMPIACRRPNGVQAYRAYYFFEKRALAQWKRGEYVPRWFGDMLIAESKGELSNV